MTPERRKRTIISLLLLCAMLPCAFFSLRHCPHRSAWDAAFFVLMILNFAFIAKYQSTRRQPDTMTHLFPAPSENSKERS